MIYIIVIVLFASQWAVAAPTSYYAMKVVHMRHIPYDDILCAELHFASAFRDYTTQQVTVTDLSLDVSVSTIEEPYRIQNVTLSNSICHESGNIGSLTDSSDIIGYKSSIHFCGLFITRNEKQRARIVSINSQSMRAYLHSKGNDVPEPIDCPVLSSVTVIEHYNVAVSGLCRDGECTVTCASYSIGDGGEVMMKCDTGQCDPNDNVRLYDELRIKRSTVLMLPNQFQCVEPSVIVSKDIEVMFLDRTTNLTLKTLMTKKQSVMTPLDNSFCFGVTDRHDRYTMGYPETNNMICTSKPHIYKGRSLVNGTLSYVAITKSGYRLLRRVEVRNVKVELDRRDIKIHNYCEIERIKDICRDCHETCHAKVVGTGYVLCKDHMVHLSNDGNDTRISRLPYKRHQRLISDLSEDEEILTTGDSTDGGGRRIKVHWIVIAVLSGLICIGVILEFVVFRSK